MSADNEFKFNLCVSQEAYPTKPPKEGLLLNQGL